MRSIIYACLFCLIAVACSNDDPDPLIDINRVYSSSRIEKLDLGKMYTQSGEDHDFDETYTSTSANPISISFNTDTEILDNNEKEGIEFKKDHAVFTDLESDWQSSPYSYHIDGGFIQFISEDTTSYEPTYFNNLIKHLGLHKSLNNDQLIDNGGIYYNPERYAKVISGNIWYPRIQYVLISNNTSIIGFINNEIDETVFEYLAENDLLLVQQQWVIYE